MVKIIMHGCNGHMGQVISGIVEKDPDAEIVAGIDIADQGKNSYPVFTDIDACQVEADAIIDFSSAKATDKLLEYSAARQIPVVLCSTGLSQEQLAKVEETSRKVAVLKSANMSLGINTLLKLVQDAAKVLAAAGFDMDPVAVNIGRILVDQDIAEEFDAHVRIADGAVTRNDGAVVLRGEVAHQKDHRIARSHGTHVVRLEVDEFLLGRLLRLRRLHPAAGENHADGGQCGDRYGKEPAHGFTSPNVCSRTLRRGIRDRYRHTWRRSSSTASP